METPINKLVSSFVWVAVLALLLMVSIAVESGWTILTTLALSLGVAVAVINAIFQTIFFIMAMLTKGVVSIPKAAMATATFTGRATGVSHDNGSVIWRHYLFKKTFASLVGLLIVVVGSVLAGTLQFPILLLISIGLAAAFMKLPDWAETARDNGFIQRTFTTGTGARETYTSARKALAYADDFESQKHPTGGCLTKKFFLGETLVENTVIPKLVFLDNPACSLTVGAIGSAKLVADIGPNMILGEFSVVGITPKPEFVDLFCHRRCDPEMHRGLAKKLGVDPGVDPRPNTNVRFHIPGSRSQVLDPENRSRLDGTPFPVLHEIDVRNAREAIALIAAIAMALLPDNPQSKEPYFRNVARMLIRFLTGMVVTNCRPERRNLVTVVRYLKGMYGKDGNADPTRLKQLFVQGLRNKALSGTIQADASELARLPDRTIGTVIVEAGEALSWILPIRSHFEGLPRFSYREVGADKNHPVSVFVVPPSIDPNSTKAFMRLHAALATTLMMQRKESESYDTWVCCDEAPQYLAGSGIIDKAFLLRAWNIRIGLYGQSVPAFVNAVGEDAFEAFCATATEKYFGVNDLKTAQRVVDLFGERTLADGSTVKMMSPQDVMYRDLNVSSPLMCVKPYGGQIMRLMRRGYISIDTPYGLKIKGLPFDGHFDPRS